MKKKRIRKPAVPETHMRALVNSVLGPITICRMPIAGRKMTDNEAEVTCGNCLRRLVGAEWNPNPKGSNGRGLRP